MILICPNCHAPCELKRGERQATCPKCGHVCKLRDSPLTDSRDFIN
ncbi:MAG: hypothetical protein KAH93_04845 [Candidatus Aenigmarchaeota archaeon]|nr:hypothetical protein [Candidatus Aenigmarchaeota archaeon]